MSREIPKTVQYAGAAPSVADAKRAVESCLDTSSSHHHSLAPELASVRDKELRHLDLSGPVSLDRSDLRYRTRMDFNRCSMWRSVQ